MIDLTREKLLNPKPGYIFSHYAYKYTMTIVQVRGSHIVTEIKTNQAPSEDPIVRRYSSPSELEGDFLFADKCGYEIEYQGDTGYYRHWPQGLKGRMTDMIEEAEETKLT